MIRRGLLGFAVVVGMVVLPAASVVADVGDGKLACNIYEICFARDDSNTTYQKHFYNAGNHDNYQFTNVNTGATNQGALRDGADQVANRDGSCDVRVVDDRGILPDDYQDVPNQPNSLSWKTLIASVDNENDRHERVNCS